MEELQKQIERVDQTRYQSRHDEDDFSFAVNVIQDKTHLMENYPSNTVIPNVETLIDNSKDTDKTLP